MCWLRLCRVVRIKLVSPVSPSLDYAHLHRCIISKNGIPHRISIISKNANQTWYSLQEKHCCSLSEACVLCQCFDPFYTSNFLISKLQHLSIESLLLRLLWYILCMRDLTRVFCSIFVLLFIQYGWEAITRFLPSNLAVASWHFVEHRFFWLVVNNSIVVFSIFNNNKTPCLHINMW